MQKVYLAVIAVLLLGSGCTRLNIKRPSSETAGHIVQNTHDSIITYLTNGITKLNLTGEPGSGVVVSARRNNGVSPHAYTNYSFFVNTTTDHGAFLSQVEIMDTSTGKLSDILSTYEGADCVLKDAVLVKKNNSRPSLVIATRDDGDSYADRQKVTFDYYTLRDNRDGDWMPDYWYEFATSSRSRDLYCDVDEAIKKEFAQ